MSNENTGCCARFKAELCALSFFGEQDISGKTLDIDASFCLREKRTWSTIVCKLVLLGLVWSALVTGFIYSPDTVFYLAYVSNWNVIYSCTYLSFSFLGTILRNPPFWVVKAAWVMYSVAVVHGLAVVILYWTTEFGPNTDLRFDIIMAHAVVFPCCVVDGLIINNVPVRLKHYLFGWLFGMLFVSWTLAQAFVPVDNPYKDGETNGGVEALYNILDWVNEPAQAAIVSVLVFFVAFPIFELLFWGLSIPYRRYATGEESADQEDGPKTHSKPEQFPEADVEEGEEVAAQVY